MRAAVLLILVAIAAYVYMAGGHRRGRWGKRGSWGHDSGRRSSSWTGRWSRMKDREDREDRKDRAGRRQGRQGGKRWSRVKPMRPMFPGGPDVPSGYALSKSGIRNPGMYN